MTDRKPTAPAPDREWTEQELRQQDESFWTLQALLAARRGTRALADVGFLLTLPVALAAIAWVERDQ